MNKRERSIAIAVGAVVGILFLNYILIEPLWAAREDLKTQIAKAQTDYRDAVRLIHVQPINEQDFQRKKAAGLASDVSTAQGAMVNKLGEWGRMTGVEVTNISPSNSPSPMPKLGGKPNEKDKFYSKLMCSASIKGRMTQICQFLYQIQMSENPIRVTDLTFEPEKEGQDGLKISLKISSIFLVPDATASGRATIIPATRAAGQTAPLQAGGSTRPATGPSAQATTPAMAAPVITNPGSLSMEEQMKLRRLQQSQPQAANVAPASAPATQPETR